MDLTDIKNLLAQFDASTLQELDLSDGSERIYFSKQVTTTAKMSQEVPVPSITEASEQITNQGDTINQPVANQFLVKAPLVGTIYLQPGDEQPVYKQIGDHVKVGEPIAIIEAMKMMTEIPSPIAGIVTKIFVNNEEIVEYDQPLIGIEPAM